MSRVRKSLAWVLTFALLAAAIVYTIATNSDWQRFDLDQFIRSFASFNWQWIALAVLLVYATLGIRAIRWRVLMDSVKPNPSLWKLFSATVVGFGAIGVMGRAGEFVRPLLIARQENTPVSTQFAVWVVERTLDGIMMLVWAGLATLVLPSILDPDDDLLQPVMRSLGVFIAVGAVSIFILLIFVRHYYDAFAEKLLHACRFLPGPKKARLARWLDVFNSGLHAVRDDRSLVLGLVWSVVEWASIGATFYTVLMACNCGVAFTIADSVVFTVVLVVGTLLHIPGIGGGIQVSAILVLTRIFGVAVEPATTVAILVWSLLVLNVIPASLVLLALDGISWRKLRELEWEA